MRYYIKDGGAVRGPWVWVEIRSKMRSGKLSDRALVRDEKGTDWYRIAALEDEHGRRDDQRGKSELSEAMHDARRRARAHLVAGGAMLFAGVGATIATTVAAGVVGGAVLVVFSGLIIGGCFEVGRGLRIRP